MTFKLAAVSSHGSKICSRLQMSECCYLQKIEDFEFQSTLREVYIVDADLCLVLLVSLLLT